MASKSNGVPYLVVVTSEMHYVAVFREKEMSDIHAELKNEKAYLEAGGDRYVCSYQPTSGVPANITG